MPYQVLYDYQFSERYQRSKVPVHSSKEISKERTIRFRIREIMHRENWDGFIEYLESSYPEADFPISFLSYWFGKFGFDKPQTRCKFGDFLKYLINVRRYYQVEMLVPPSVLYSVWFIDSQRKLTYLQRNSEEINEINIKRREVENREKVEEIERSALPGELSKKFMCRYYMAGNCHKPDHECNYAHSITELAKQYELGQ